jgi:hypothetical protein
MFTKRVAKMQENYPAKVQVFCSRIKLKSQSTFHIALLFRMPVASSVGSAEASASIWSGVGPGSGGGICATTYLLSKTIQRTWSELGTEVLEECV